MTIRHYLAVFAAAMLTLAGASAAFAAEGPDKVKGFGVPVLTVKKMDL